ncbi:MAG: beta-phosphoglucomutase [Clostridiales bacterium]|nr:beta-phosphoglucomutase [Clostridiales bacterium]
MSRFKAFLFDLDGVICDTAKYHYLAWKRLADMLGIPFDEKANEAFKGVSRMRCMELLLEFGNRTADDEEKVRLADMKNEWYVEYLHDLDRSELLPGALEVLEECRRRGIKTAICSASKNAPLILSRLEITDYFDAVIDGNKVTKAKPDPEVFLLGAKELGVEPAECVIFEDSLAGVQAGISENIFVVGIGKPENLPGADIVVENLSYLDVDSLLKA